MSDLRIQKRRDKYVIQDYDNGRKQVRDTNNKKLAFTNKSDAKAAIKELMALELKGTVKLGARHKFKDKFQEFADNRYEIASDEDTALTKQGVRGYLSYSKNHIAKWFPDIYLDELDGMVLEQFAQTCFANNVTWKTVRNIVRHIHTTCRWFMEKKYHNDFASALNWKLHKQHHLKPKNREDEKETKTEVITPEEANKVLAYVEKHKDRSHKDALAYTIFTILALFGLRPSEIQGLKRSTFNFDAKYVWIKGSYLGREGGYRSRTKNDESNRALDFTEKQSKHLQWIMDYMNKYKQHNPYILPASRLGQDGQYKPIAQYEMRKLIYKTYEAVGLAKLEWFKKCNTWQYNILNCRFKDGPAKCWRHYNATMLIDNMYTLGLTPNYIKSRLGHSRWQTTQDRYGNHNMVGSDEMRLERADKVEKALGYNK
tara:strand:+ start:302 stop:1585 length:1284 start_codon:yes stop_codon:yes gene_type:complete